MADAIKPKLTVVAPIFAVTDVRRALEYFAGKLMFTVAFQWADADDAPIRYAILQSGDCELHVSHSEKPHKCFAYFFVRGVREYYEIVKANGALITQHLQDLPWDMREFEVADPDGNTLIFGEHLSNIK